MGFVAGIGLALGLPDPEGLLHRARTHELSLVDSLGPLFVETVTFGVTRAERALLSALRGRGS